MNTIQHPKKTAPKSGFSSFPAPTSRDPPWGYQQSSQQLNLRRSRLLRVLLGGLSGEFTRKKTTSEKNTREISWVMGVPPKSPKIIDFRRGLSTIFWEPPIFGKPPTWIQNKWRHDRASRPPHWRPARVKTEHRIMNPICFFFLRRISMISKWTSRIINVSFPGISHHFMIWTCT